MRRSQAGGMFFALFPLKTAIPSDRKERVKDVSSISEPQTATSLAFRRRARPDAPIPPIPEINMFFAFSNIVVIFFLRFLRPLGIFDELADFGKGLERHAAALFVDKARILRIHLSKVLYPRTKHDVTCRYMIERVRVHPRGDIE